MDISVPEAYIMPEEVKKRTTQNIYSSTVLISQLSQTRNPYYTFKGR